jgi:hypothetical protein
VKKSRWLDEEVVRGSKNSYRRGEEKRSVVRSEKGGVESGRRWFGMRCLEKIKSENWFTKGELCSALCG